MAENFLDLVQTATCVDQEAGEGVAQVMDAEFWHTCRLPRRVPRIEDADKGFPSLWVGENVGAVLSAGDLRQQSQSAVRERYVARFARLRDWNAPYPSLDIEVAPLSLKHLAFTPACKDQHGNDMTEHKIFTLENFVIEALHLFFAEETFFLIVFLKNGNSRAGVAADARNFPSHCKIKNISDQDQYAISCCRSIALGSEPMVKGNHVVFHNLIKMLFPECWENVITEEAFVSLARPLIPLNKRQVTFCDELVEGRYGLQRLSLLYRVSPDTNLCQQALCSFPSLISRQDCRRSNFQLFLLSMSIAITDVKSLSARWTNFKYETLHLKIEVVSLCLSFIAKASPDKLCIYICIWHDISPAMHIRLQKVDG